ncbi:MAG: RluA family pseudouridine synthase [Bacteroidales bacterium]|nr:RluA family pseudouridine synthase [Bacteroidales bacterium]
MVEAQDEERDSFEHYRVVADAGQTLLRVDKFLTNRLEDISRSKIQEAADDGLLLANGVPVKSNYKVKPFDIITIEKEFPKFDLEIIPENIPLDILYEDDYLLVVNKQAGLVVHPGYGNYSGTLVNALAFHLRENPMFSTNNQRPGMVHRIDKDTSGILVIAKTESAMTMLAKQFAEKTAKREYIALVWGLPKEMQGTITGYLGRDLKDRKLMYVFDNEEHGKWAVTHYQVIEEIGYVSLVKCILETGRTHQIRVQMKYIGHPLFNDKTYGGDRILKGTTFTKYKQYVQNCFTICNRQALHARLLGFIHPHTGEYMHFEVDMPNDMQALIDKWRAYVSNRDEFVDNNVEEEDYAN